MDLNTLHERTGFSMRRLRYSVDLPLIPDCAVEVTTNAQGRVRLFPRETAFYIACAAQLLEAQVRPPLIRSFLEGLQRIEWQGARGRENAIAEVVKFPMPAWGYFADGAHVRLIVDRGPAFDEPDPVRDVPGAYPHERYDSWWRSGAKRLQDSYEPTAYLTLGLGKVRRLLFGDEWLREETPPEK